MTIIGRTYLVVSDDEEEHGPDSERKFLIENCIDIQF